MEAQDEGSRGQSQFVVIPRHWPPVFWATGFLNQAVGSGLLLKGFLSLYMYSEKQVIILCSNGNHDWCCASLAHLGAHCYIVAPSPPKVEDRIDSIFSQVISLSQP